VASLSRDSKIGPVRVNHKVSTTGDGSRKQVDVEISNFHISLRDGLVTDVSFVCEFKVNSFVFDVLTSGVFLNLIGI